MVVVSRFSWLQRIGHVICVLSLWKFLLWYGLSEGVGGWSFAKTFCQFFVCLSIRLSYRGRTVCFMRLAAAPGCGSCFTVRCRLVKLIGSSVRV